jgi:uncharacterized repeat protein (TIGR03803 family)
MHSAGEKGGTKVRLNIFNELLRFASMRLVTPTIHGALTLAVPSALLLTVMTALTARAQTLTTLYSFCQDENDYCADGSYPEGRLRFDSKGNLYGTTNAGGGGGTYGDGSVFELSPNGSGVWNETVIYGFCSEGGPSCTDGARPAQSDVIFDSAGNLYGTASQGGANGYGVVFELSPAGTGWTENVLYSFTGGSDGGYPATGLTMDGAGNLFGTTSYATNNIEPVVFELRPSGGGWTEQVIYTFTNNNDGITPSGLTIDAHGNIFGAQGLMVYELSPNGSGGWNAAVLHTFLGKWFAADGTPVLDKNGNVYGTLMHINLKDASEEGEVYKLSLKEGEWKVQVLEIWQDGFGPAARVVLDAAGNVYGTTVGTNDGPGQGSVFELVAPVKGTKYTSKILSDMNGLNGNEPLASMILDSAGNLYGTTYMGGSGNGGVVFEVTP